MGRELYEADLTERLVDTIAEMEPVTSSDLSKRLQLPILEIRKELRTLEALGILYRTGNTRGTRWWLG